MSNDIKAEANRAFLENFTSYDRHTIDDEGLITVHGSTKLSQKYRGDQLPCRFREVTGDFEIGFTHLKTLLGWDIRTTSAKYILYFLNCSLLIGAILVCRHLLASKLGMLLLALIAQGCSGFGEAGHEFFTVSRERCRHVRARPGHHGGNRLQALARDRLAGVRRVAVLTDLEALERSVDFLDRLARLG